MKEKIKERFEKYYIPEPNSGCWLWIGGHSRKSGYGNFRLITSDVKIKMAHRASVYLFHKTYNPNLCALHKCDNPACVNPDHLYQGTMKDNANDRALRGRFRYGPLPKRENHFNAKLTNKDVIQMKKLFRKGKSIKEVHELFPQVCRANIEAIKYKKSWVDIG